MKTGVFCPGEYLSMVFMAGVSTILFGLNILLGSQLFLICLKQFIVVIPDHLFNKFSPQSSIAMFTAQGTLVFFYQHSNFCSNGPEHPVSFFGFQVDDGPEMNFSGTCMGIMNGMQIRVSSAAH